MDKLIFVILGKSGAGKTYLAKEISKYFNYTELVSSTSRPMREGEIEGVDYFFKTKEEMIKLQKENKFVESVCYNGWYYGVEKETIEKTNSNCVVVLDPKGYRRYKEIYGEKVIGIYIDTNDKNRLLRSIYREENPHCYEICRRLLTDTEEFKSIESDRTIIKIDNNSNLAYAINDLKDVIIEALNNKYWEDYYKERM